MKQVRRVGWAMVLCVSVGGHGLDAQEVVMIEGADRALSPTVELVYEIGTVAGGTWESFADLQQNDLGFDAAGNLYILDAGNSRVVVVSPEGEFVKQLGRAGEGPGEFMNPSSIAVHNDGSFVVFDFGHRALLYFDASGEFEEQIATALASLPGSQLRPDGRGNVLSASGQGVVIMTRDEGSTPRNGAPIKRYSRANGGEIEDLYSAWRWPQPGLGGARTAPEVFSRPLRPIRAFRPGFMFDALPNGGAVAIDSVEYRLKVVDPAGGLDRILTRPIEPRRVTRQDQEREREYRRDRLTAGEGPRFQMSTPGGSQSDMTDLINERRLQQIDEMVFEEFFPALQAVQVDWEGRIWAERTGEDPNGPGPIDVISADEQYLGTIPEDGIRRPDAFGPDGLAAWIEPDDFDVPIVRVRRLQLNR